MYHCHILTHEDTSMMHQFVVVDSLDFYTGIFSIPGTEELLVFPNPAGDMLSFKGTINEPGTLRFYDPYGRIARQADIASLANITLPVYDLPRGVIILRFTSGGPRYVQKVSLH